MEEAKSSSSGKHTTSLSHGHSSPKKGYPDCQGERMIVNEPNGRGRRARSLKSLEGRGIRKGQEESMKLPRHNEGLLVVLPLLNTRALTTKKDYCMYQLTSTCTLHRQWLSSNPFDPLSIPAYTRLSPPLHLLSLFHSTYSQRMENPISANLVIMLFVEDMTTSLRGST